MEAEEGEEGHCVQPLPPTRSNSQVSVSGHPPLVLGLDLF